MAVTKKFHEERLFINATKKKYEDNYSWTKRRKEFKKKIRIIIFVPMPRVAEGGGGDSSIKEFGTEPAKNRDAVCYFGKRTCQRILNVQLVVMLLNGITVRCKWDLVKATSLDCLPCACVNETLYQARLLSSFAAAHAAPSLIYLFSETPSSASKDCLPMDFRDVVLTRDFDFVPRSYEDHSQHNVLTEPSSYNSKSTKRAKNSTSSKLKSNKKPTVKDQRMHKFLFEKGGLEDRTRVAYRISKGKTLKGRKEGQGIRCFCCDTVISPSKFEAHAKRSGRRKPYDHIFLSNGDSLHAYASKLKLTGKHVALDKDDVCDDCQEGGDLLPCSGCPRSFHAECISTGTPVPLENYLCKHCQDSMKCVGPVSISPTKEESTNRCIWINDNQNKHDLVACSLCRSHDFSLLSVDGFNDKTVIVCDQCELEFHIGCLRAHSKHDLKELPSGGWFCSSKCSKLNREVKVLVALGPQKVLDSTNCNGEWRIVRGKHTTEENSLLLNEAAKIFDAGFNPIEDTMTKKDMIKAMTYGAEIAGSDFAGVHCAILTIGPKVVTAGLFRVLGHDVAELPIVATGQQYQGQGYFKVFFGCFERLLSQLNVKKLVVPAAEEVIAMWCNKFGLRKVTPTAENEYRQKHTSMVAFTGTSLLEKEVPVGQRLL